MFWGKNLKVLFNKLLYLLVNIIIFVMFDTVFDTISVNYYIYIFMTHLAQY